MEGISKKYRLAVAAMNDVSGQLTGAGFRESSREISRFPKRDSSFVFGTRRHFVLPDCELSIMLGFSLHKKSAGVIFGVCEVEPNRTEGFGAWYSTSYYHATSSFGVGEYDQFLVFRDASCCLAAKILGKAKLAPVMDYLVAGREAYEIFQLEKISPFLTEAYSHLENAGFVLNTIERDKPFVFENKAGQTVTIHRDNNSHLAVTANGVDLGAQKFPVDVAPLNLLLKNRTMLVSRVQGYMKKRRRQAMMERVWGPRKEILQLKLSLGLL